MERLNNVLSSFCTDCSALRILDVATGSGFFLDTVANAVPANVQVVGYGIDVNPKAIDSASQRFPESNYHFETMNSHHMTYENQTFDIVCISNSLHHFDEPHSVLNEMTRVLKPDGLLIVYEMVKDNQSDRQMTHVLLHHYWAEIDERSGISHKQTYSRGELSQLFDVYPNLTVLHQWEVEDTDSDTSDEMIESLTSSVSSYLERTQNWSDSQLFSDKADMLLNRIHSIGFDLATECFWIFKKES